MSANVPARSFDMRNRFDSLYLLIMACAMAVPAYSQGRSGFPAPLKGPSAPAPRRDITGVWLGPVDPRKQPMPPLTPWGQKSFDDAKPLQGPRALPMAKTNDPLATCDPLGFPRATLYE